MRTRARNWRQVGCSLAFLIAGSTGGVLGVWLGLIAAHELLHLVGKTKTTELDVVGMHVAMVAAGIGGALGVWIGKHLSPYWISGSNRNVDRGE